MHDAPNPMIRAYKQLRLMVGGMGLILPFVLLIGGYLIYGTWGRTSISAYHFTPLDDYFAGTLFAIGAFLAFYPRYGWVDRFFGLTGWICAWGVALCPTAPICNPTAMEITMAHWHRGFAAGFFGSLIAFSILFCLPLSQRWARFFEARLGRFLQRPALGLWHVARPDYGRWKLTKNVFFLVCAGVMLVCLGGITYYRTTNPDFCGSQPRLEFWLESAAVWAFSSAWLVKAFFG